MNTSTYRIDRDKLLVPIMVYSLETSSYVLRVIT